MKNSSFEPLSRRIINFPQGLGIKDDMQELCSFTLERCLFNAAPGEKEQLCPFTLEPLCMKTRALSSSWD